jgi:hypothetical protein
LGGFAENLAKFREQGPLRGTAKAARLAWRRVRDRIRAERLIRRRITLRPGELDTALAGEDPVAVLRGRVRDAMPTVSRWEASLDDLDAAGRKSVFARADRIRAHEFDLLGSGPTALGAEIDWSRDFKSGRVWPPVHISRFVTVYPDASDVKVPWELSRFQHLPLLAAAHRLSADDRYLDEIGAQLDSWISSNPVEFGPNWGCTMDVAIRAANWIATLAICAEDARDAPWFQRALGSLLLHGRFIDSHPEYGEVRGNHYLSDVAGLLVVSALFAGGEEGRGWLRSAADELEVEMEHQVHPDGADHEASVPYHRLVSELFICGGQVVEALVPDRPREPFRSRLALMLDLVADYTLPNGLVPQLGDADDGRFLPLGDYASADFRSHRHLFAQAGNAPSGSAGKRTIAYPGGGLYVMRDGDLYVIVRAGDTGLRGRGGHAHNDQLSFELAGFGESLVVDPGAFVYTADPAERNRFRSTSFHSTLQIDGAEQNELDSNYLFSLPDRTRTEVVSWDPGGRRLRARHHGYSSLPQPATVTRSFTLSGDGLTIEDEVDSAGPHDLVWTFPLAGGEPRIESSRCVVEFEGVVLEIEAPEGVRLRLDEGWISPSYGVRRPAPFLRGAQRSESAGGRWRWHFSVERP